MSLKYFEVVGKTTDGKLCLSGVYNFFETVGLPLDLIIEILYDKGYIPAWDNFYHEAAMSKMKHSSIMIKITDCVQFIKRLDNK